ncbi:hypothetical protein [Heyndrickxia camelliae]|uniref:Uncharacterized protein n=1 Tax=Heyndrickxia camelliae TaxID=1707093 RepID=A0A2N3LEE0_9BACI|nr:hypothetical protein [Heyndrickxia camelliae]PKR82904.1 hypothetical protein CWO92_22195 [Heyndrickxia camelliae]
MEELFQRVLDAAGYEGEPNASNIELCFLDYVADGMFANLTLEEAMQEIENGEITIKQMCSNLLRVCR